MTDTKVLIFIDFETTGLLEDPVPPTALEVSWIITDAAGEPLTPQCQAFVALPLGNGPVHLPGPDGWPEPDYPGPAVREMHDRNGLAVEWVAARRDRPDALVWGWAELERLLLDDLVVAGWRALGPREAQLAGAGVGHFEQRFLTWCAPRVFADARMHYRTHDVSVILGGLHVVHPKLPDKVDTLLGAQPRPDYPASLGHGWSRVGPLSGLRYAAADHGGAAGHDATPDVHWALLDADPHRAAPGIARALMAHRILGQSVLVIGGAPCPECAGLGCLACEHTGHVDAVHS